MQSFANHSHQASVRSVAAGGKYLASGGADESIILYDMVARKEAGLLMHHRGKLVKDDCWNRVKLSCTAANVG